MAQQKAEAALNPASELGTGRYKLKKNGFDVFFVPEENGNAAKIMVSMKVDGVKVPPNGSSGTGDVGLAEFNGEENGGEFVFFISKVEAKITNPRATSGPKEFLIEFDVPGAVARPRNLLPKKAARSKKASPKKAASKARY